MIENWDAMEKVWGYIFQQLEVDPSECNGVVLTEAIGVPKANRTKMLETMFGLEVSNCYIVGSAEMSLYTTGRTTGLVVDSGEGVT